MKPEIPILMITLQIPVQPDTSADDVLQAIGETVSEAIEDIKRKQGGRRRQVTETEQDVEMAPDQAEFNATVLRETLEAYGSDTRPDLLTALGYKARD